MLYVSILGDSISTYTNYNPQGYSVYYDGNMQSLNGMTSVYDTWWAKVNQALHAYLCVNNSYSGSKVAGTGFPAASSPQRTGALHTTTARPQIILIYIGFNDFGNGINIRKDHPNNMFDNDGPYFEDCYRKMLSDIKRNYPDAKILCATLMRTCIKEQPDWHFPEYFAGIPYKAYNEAIRNVCRQEGCFLADLEALNMRYETLDGTHPTAQGHVTLYHGWVHWLATAGLL